MTLMALLSSRDIPHPKKKEWGRAREGCVGCTTPMTTHSCSMLPLAAPVCDDVIPGWGVHCAGTGIALVLVAHLCPGQWVGPSLGFAWQGLIISVRGGRAATAVQKVVLWVPKRQRHQGHHTRVSWCSVRAVQYLTLQNKWHWIQKNLYGPNILRFFRKWLLFLNV